jgi:hypothetical protein
MKNNDSFIYWKCGDCNSHHISDKKKRHQMDWCKCGNSALDAEEFYSRGIGNVIEITKEEYDNRVKRK